ncbi:alpha/beta fold hydrolase [Candidatus Woesearchaeota archaeon]|nr:alpha/beta fold hydrolase [Candidatus Woesearchaeota archaeon]
MGLANLVRNEVEHGLKNVFGVLKERINGKRFSVKNLDQQRAVEKNPVVLLHGYLQNRGVMLPLETKLRSEGFGCVHRLNYDFFRGVEETAGYINKELKIILSATRDKKVDLVGHSLGGLVALYTSLAFPEKVDRCVMLGSPNHGTWLASFGYLAVLGKPFKIFGMKFDCGSALDMTPGIGFQKKLRGLYKNDGVRRYSIFTPFDALIIEKNSEKLSYACNVNTEDLGAKDVGHASILTDDRVMDYIVGLLKE